MKKALSTTVANIPGAVPITATQALTNAVFLCQEIAQLGWKKACEQNHHLARGLDCAEGTLHNTSVAEAFYSSPIRFDCVFWALDHCYAQRTEAIVGDKNILHSGKGTFYPYMENGPP